MSTRTGLAPESVITNGSMAASLTSRPTILQSLTRGSYQIIWSAGSTPVGTIGFQGSNNYSLNPDGTVNNAGTWTDLNFDLAGVTVSTIPVSGNSGNGVLEFESGLNAVRIIYTRASGSGTLNATIKAKVA